MKLTLETERHIYKSSITETQPNQYYRHPHDIEIKSYDLGYDKGGWVYMGDGYVGGKPRANAFIARIPEVYRLEPDQTTQINCEWQWLWKNLNPKLSNKTWSTLLGNSFAFTNKTGFPGRHDCVNNTGLDYGFPTLDAPRVCGGAILKGVESNGYLLIESLIQNQPVPLLEEVLSKFWLWFWATSVDGRGVVNLITKKGTDGQYYPVRIPLITKNPVKLRLETLHKLPLGYVPNDARWLPNPP